jgi:ABC-type transport system involved in multi-copper enzyme maturation permease subunit
MGTMSVVMLAQATTAVNVNWPLVIGVSAALLVALLAYLYGTRGGIIARATCKEAVRQPVFAMMMALSMSLLVINTFVPFFSLGEDVKMLKDCGLATILITSLLLAVWTASTSIADEIEGKTAMTLLSKPITRRQFIVGKYLGIVTSILWLMVPTALVFLGLIFFKFFYDAKESSKSGEDVTTALAVAEVVQIIPGLLLSFMEVSVLAAVSVAISTRLPMVVNLVTCLAIFVVGHLTPALVESSTGGLEPVLFVARLIATVLPALDVFNVAASVATGSIVPANYLGYALIYAMCYCTMGVLLAFILFEDRDLA